MQGFWGSGVISTEMFNRFCDETDNWKDSDDAGDHHDCSVNGYSDEELYAIIVEPNKQLIDITPQDYVLTLNDIVAYNPETGEMKVKGGERISEKAFPVPTQWSILFYSKGKLLFTAKLNSVISSTIGGPGLIFEHWWGPDKDGYSRFKLEQIRIVDEKGRVLDGDLSYSEKVGLALFESILKSYGRINKNITWEWKNKY